MFISEEGTLWNENGDVVRKFEEKGLACIAATSSYIFCGGYEKMLVIVTSEDETISLE